MEKFYSKYDLIDSENMHVFTGNFSLRVINLSQIDNVPEETRSSELYLWMRLLRATTWEEVKMLAKENQMIQEAAKHLHILTKDEKIRLQCEGRMLYENDMATARGDGEREGIKKGRKEGQSEINRLTRCLLDDDRLDDLRRSVNDPSYQKQLMREYGISTAGA